MQRATWNEPFDRFRSLYAEVCRVVTKDPNASSLATVDDQGRPSVRVVLMKDFDERGFTFYTNGLSTKGKALKHNHLAALNFYWPEMEQQVRIEGTVDEVSTEEADAYFASRPRVSQLGAWASHQSQPLDSRETLERRLQEIMRQYENQAVPRPPHWGGFRLMPDSIEFWRAHPHRLHWRERYQRQGNEWERTWLNP